MSHSTSRGHSLEKLRLVFSDNCRISIQKPANASQLSTNASGFFPVPTRHFTQISMSSANGNINEINKIQTSAHQVAQCISTVFPTSALQSRGTPWHKNRRGLSTLSHRFPLISNFLPCPLPPTTSTVR